MPFPTTAQGLRDEGYIPDGRGRCRGCGALIFWYRTPKRKRIPLNPSTLEPHWATCPKASEFRSKKK